MNTSFHDVAGAFALSTGIYSAPNALWNLFSSSTDPEIYKLASTKAYKLQSALKLLHTNQYASL